MKRIAFFLLAVLMLCPMIVVTADELPPLPAEKGALSLSSAEAGPGGSLEITVRLEQNPGICTFSGNIAYDATKLRLDEVKNGTVFQATEFNPDKINPYLVTWIHDGDENITATGVLCTLRFTVLSEASVGTAAVSFTCTDAYNENYVSIAFSSAQTEITILEVAAGDVDGNKTVNSADAIYLLYHALFGNDRYPVNQSVDYDKNGSVTSADAIYLLYHALFGNDRYPLS